MEIEHVNPGSVRGESNQELLSLHRHLHGLWAQHFEGNEKARAGGLTREDLVNAHLVVRDDMKRRKLEHKDGDGLHKAAREIGELNLNNQTTDTMVVPNFVSVVGSAVGKENPEDIDVLFRADRVEGQGGPGFFIRAEDVELPVRKRIDPEKKGLQAHWLANPQGPHDEYRPVADLVLRWREDGVKQVAEYGRRLQRAKIDQIKDAMKQIGGLQDLLRDLLVWAQYNDGYWPQNYGEADGRVRIDLGCGENKPDGYIGVDKRDVDGVDIVHDLEGGLPFEDDYADEIRANHVLEHLSEPVRAMTEIWRVLKPGGMLEFEVPSTETGGAFADPSHRSFWNEDSFAFYSRPELTRSVGFPGRFEAEELEQVEREGRMYVRGRLRAVKEGQVSELAAGSTFQPMKPAMAGYTEVFSAAEIWEWAEKRIGDGIAVEPKYNGFHAVLQKDAGVKVWFEDSKQNRELPGINEKLAKLPGFIAVANVGIDRDGKPASRPDLNVLTGKKPELGADERVKVTLFDLLFWEGDLHDQGWTKRRAALGRFYGRYLKDDQHFAMSPVRQVRNRGDLDSALKWASKVEGSEGAMLKHMPSPYSLGGASQDWAKLKKVVEIKAIVLRVQANKNRTWSYWGGVLPGEAEWTNREKLAGVEYVNLGKTLATDIKASPGDVITVQVSEIVPSDGKLGWVVPKVVDVDKARSRPYFAKQLEDIAKRGGAWQARAAEAEPREETRAGKAEASWADNWRELVGKGSGRFILHGHFPSLTEDEAKEDLDALLAGNNQYHSDLRLEAPAPHGAWGFSCFEGQSSQVGPTGTRLTKMPADKPMRGTFKLENPKEWLTFAKGAPKTTESVGRVGKERAKFFALDHGTYELTFAREHSFEVLLKGEKGAAKGRYQINYVPVGGRERVWMITRPANQESTYPEEHTLESVVTELKRKGQDTLFWREPGGELKKIDVGKFEEGEMNIFDTDVLTDDELVEAAKTAKASAALKRGLQRALSALKNKDKTAALSRLKDALEAIADYGYAYGYPSPKASEFLAEVSTAKIKAAVEKAIDAAEKEDFDAAMAAVEKLLADLGYGSAKETFELETAELAESLEGVEILAEGAAPDNGRGPLTLRVKLIEPGRGNPKHRHYYPADMLRRDARIFVGSKMHESQHGDDKTTRNWVSTVTDIVGFSQSGAPLAEVVVHDPDFAQRVRNLGAKNLLDKLECSILATGACRAGKVDGEEVQIVEAITRAENVDWVVKAGAGGKALELMEKEQHMDKTDVRRVLDAANVPEAVVERLSETGFADEAAVKAAVAAEMAYLVKATGSGKVTGNGPADQAQRMTRDEYVAEMDAVDAKYGVRR